MITIFSYNVNGIRAALKKGLFEWVKATQPDILCMQEIKATPDQFESNIFEELGYNCIWNSADKKGYSGVALLTKQKPQTFSLGVKNPAFDVEGRVIRADYKNFILICVYVPSGTMGDERQSVKMAFLNEFYEFVANILKENRNVVISGDFNICHKPIDINFPEKHENVSGFLPEEREWFDKFINLGLIDTFRVFNKEPNNYSWWSYRQNARAKNLGWRIDYHLINEKLLPYLVDAKIHNDLYHSDHVPVSVKLNIDF
ncbi:MAG: exodeoxyribonuclease III [Bacteroidales bacterium]|nr:exodeoxyribonuclease III [Bacteroidales bacterium]